MTQPQTHRTRPAAAGTVLHFWAQGPGALTVAADGTARFPWYLDRVDGTDRETARRAVTDVLTDPRGWVRAGIVYAEVARVEEALLRVRVIPAATTVCGAGAAGCYSWGWPDGPPIAEMGVEYLRDLVAWRYLVNMEAGGHALSAADMYTPAHQTEPYTGVMGTWQDAARVEGWPSDQEIEQVRKWLHGHAEVVHDDAGGPEQGVPDHPEPWEYQPPEPEPPAEPEPDAGYEQARRQDLDLLAESVQWYTDTDPQPFAVAVCRWHHTVIQGYTRTGAQAGAEPDRRPPAPPDSRDAVRQAMQACEHTVTKARAKRSPKWTGQVVLEEILTEMRGLLP